jgi:hypothetical protein
MFPNGILQEIFMIIITQKDHKTYRALLGVSRNFYRISMGLRDIALSYFLKRETVECTFGSFRYVTKIQLLSNHQAHGPITIIWYCGDIVHLQAEWNYSFGKIHGTQKRYLLNRKTLSMEFSNGVRASSSNGFYFHRNTIPGGPGCLYCGSPLPHITRKI